MKFSVSQWTAFRCQRFSFFIDAIQLPFKASVICSFTVRVSRAWIFHLFHWRLFILRPFYLLSFAGNELLGTENIILYLARNCIDLQVICVNYFHSTNNFEIERSFVFLLQRCRKLKEVILNGLFVNNLVVHVYTELRVLCVRQRGHIGSRK